MKNIRKLIIILTIICLIIIIAIIILLNSIKSKIDDETKDYDLPVEDNSRYEEELNQNLVLVQSENDFFSLENEIKNFFLYYKVENKNAIYEILNEQYITDNNITVENIIEEISKLYAEKENNFIQEINRGRRFF